MKLSTTLFAASFVSVVAAGWNHLDASAPTDGPAAAPALREVTVDGQSLRVGLDRERVPAGEAVHATISLASPTAKGLDVRVQLLEQTSSPMARMASPPREVASRKVHLGAEPTVLPFTLAAADHGKGADPLDTAGSAVQYTVVVTSAKEGGAGDGAYLPVFAYEPEAYQLSIESPGTGKVGEAVDVAVHVKSLAKKTLKQVSVGLSTSFLAITENPVIDALAPGAEEIVHVKATRTAPADGALFVQAYAWAGYGGSASAWLTIDRESGQVSGQASEPYAMLTGF